MHLLPAMTRNTALKIFKGKQGSTSLDLQALQLLHSVHA